jgi:hypothetical protein
MILDAYIAGKVLQAGLCTSQQLTGKWWVFKAKTDFLLFPLAGFLERLDEL